MMKDLLVNTGFGAGLMLFVIITIAFCLVIYLAFHYLIRKHLNPENKNVGVFLFRFSAALLAFIISITFANERVNYFRVQSSIEKEASKLVDVHLDLRLYDTDSSNLIQAKVRDYILFIADDGWKSLQEDPFMSKPIVLFRSIYQDINYLETKTTLQERLKQKMINSMDQALGSLQSKIYSSGSDSNHLIYTSIFGLAVLMLLFAVYPPDLLTLGFLSLYVAFIAVVLYFILMMGNPLQGPLQLDPGPFILLKETIENQF